VSLRITVFGSIARAFLLVLVLLLVLDWLRFLYEDDEEKDDLDVVTAA
jgi:hypothetical protein